MKQVIKNNLNILFTVFISGILFTSVGVYAATQYLAKDVIITPDNVNFKATNVEEAINELYYISNTKLLPSTFTIKLQSASISSTNYGQGAIVLDDFYKKYYSKFKITFTNKSSNANCGVYLWSSSKSTLVDITLNNEYLIYNDSDGFKFSKVFSNVTSSTNGNHAYCEYDIILYN